MSTRGAALPAALGAIAFGVVAAGAVAELTRVELVLVHYRQTAARALAAADACLAGLVGSLPAGWDFGPDLRGGDGLAGTPDDGVLPAPGGCVAQATPAPGPPDPARVLVAISGTTVATRRRLEAIVGRAARPGAPALLWLTTPPTGTITGMLALDGADAIDPSEDWSSLAAPAAPESLDAWIAAAGPGVSTSARTIRPRAAPPPPLEGLGERTRAAATTGAESLVTTGPPAPGIAFVEGDLTVDGTRWGAGLLFVGGTLDIEGALDFTGLVVAAGGIRVAPGGRLVVEGAVWAGSGATGTVLDVAGTATLLQGRLELDAVDARLALPRLAVSDGLRDVG